MLLDDARQALRIKTKILDNEIQDLIDAAKSDLMLSGVLQAKINNESNDPLIKRAIILYCKANFGLDNLESDKYQAAYNSLKTHLTLSIEYTVEAVT